MLNYIKIKKEIRNGNYGFLKLVIEVFGEL